MVFFQKLALLCHCKLLSWGTSQTMSISRVNKIEVGALSFRRNCHWMTRAPILKVYSPQYSTICHLCPEGSEEQRFACCVSFNVSQFLDMRAHWNSLWLLQTMVICFTFCSCIWMATSNGMLSEKLLKSLLLQLFRGIWNSFEEPSCYFLSRHVLKACSCFLSI